MTGGPGGQAEALPRGGRGHPPARGPRHQADPDQERLDHHLDGLRLLPHGHGQGRQADRAAAEPDATAELLITCAGLPLAIRICAARLAARSSWTIRALTNRLKDEHRRLDELKVGDLAVRASFEVSFASLSASAQTGGVAPAYAFRMLGLWHGPSISAAAAAALFGAPQDLAEDALEALVDAHLLESRSADRYKFHDLLRVYSSERAVADLSGSDRDAAIGRLLRWYMRTSDAAATAVQAAITPFWPRVAPEAARDVLVACTEIAARRVESPITVSVIVRSQTRSPRAGQRYR